MVKWPRCIVIANGYPIDLDTIWLVSDRKVLYSKMQIVENKVSDLCSLFHVIYLKVGGFLSALTFFWIAEVVVSPPFVYLPLVKDLLRSDIYVAAQNCWVRKGGAFTGEIRFVLTWFSISLWKLLLACIFCFWVSDGLCFFHSAEMLVNLSIPWVIIGHSERRALLNESNEVSYVGLV